MGRPLVSYVSLTCTDGIRVLRQEDFLIPIIIIQRDLLSIVYKYTVSVYSRNKPIAEERIVQLNPTGIPKTESLAFSPWSPPCICQTQTRVITIL